MPSRSHEPNPAQTSFEELLFSEVLREATLTSPSGGRSVESRRTSKAPPAETFSEFVPVFSVKLVRVDTIALRERPKIQRPDDVAELLWQYLRGADREHFVELLLDTKNQLIGITTISIGDLSSALIHPREVFKPAIVSNAAGILLSHNHPSGDPYPSPEDTAVTRRLCEAGETLGINVLDHVVIGERRRYVSMKERGMM